MSDRPYVLRKLFSFLGFIPLTVYVFWHITAQAQAWLGEDFYSEKQAAWHLNPFYWPLVAALIYFPLVYHAAYGLYRSFTARPNLVRLPFFANFKFLLQRITAIGLLLFIPAHVYKTRIETTLQGGRLWDHMVEGFHEPLTITIYFASVLAMAFHVANGFWLGGITWGVTVSRRAQRGWQAVTIVVFLFLAIMGGVAMAAFMRAPLVTGHF